MPRSEHQISYQFVLPTLVIYISIRYNKNVSTHVALATDGSSNIRKELNWIDFPDISQKEVGAIIYCPRSRRRRSRQNRSAKKDSKRSNSLRLMSSRAIFTTVVYLQPWNKSWVSIWKMRCRRKRFRKGKAFNKEGQAVPYLRSLMEEGIFFGPL